MKFIEPKAYTLEEAFLLIRGAASLRALVEFLPHHEYPTIAGDGILIEVDRGTVLACLTQERPAKVFLNVHEEDTVVLGKSIG